MQAYQVTSSRPTGCYTLTPACRGSRIEQPVGGRCHAVPNLPGRAKGFTPYPSSRRRRRR
ncbi:MAG TPA: hypothetical protein VKB35_11115 [Ktedonobacteraceae bacterium]|nr:hypothetical protein [Ktedonobacteraceae bacterium]